MKARRCCLAQNSKDVIDVQDMQEAAPDDLPAQELREYLWPWLTQLRLPAFSNLPDTPHSYLSALAARLKAFPKAVGDMPQEKAFIVAESRAAINLCLPQSKKQQGFQEQMISDVLKLSAAQVKVKHCTA